MPGSEQPHSWGESRENPSPQQEQNHSQGLSSPRRAPTSTPCHAGTAMGLVRATLLSRSGEGLPCWPPQPGCSQALPWLQAHSIFLSQASVLFEASCFFCFHGPPLSHPGLELTPTARHPAAVT